MPTIPRVCLAEVSVSRFDGRKTRLCLVDLPLVASRPLKRGHMEPLKRGHMETLKRGHKETLKRAGIVPPPAGLC